MRAGNPVWKAMLWMLMMLFLLRSSLTRRLRFQKIASGTEDRELPARTSVSSEADRDLMWSPSSSDIWLSEIGKKSLKTYSELASFGQQNSENRGKNEVLAIRLIGPGS